jgi:AcrR family transcriptional regulator
MDETTVGLRDRKRNQTRRRLQEAAAALVLRDGLSRATVEAICEVADVSPRTFFNYFDSKEDAVLGFPTLEIPSATELAGYSTAAGHDVVGSLIALLVDMAEPALHAGPLHESHAEILKQNPELSVKKITRMTRASDELVSAVRILMVHDPRFINLAGAASPLAEMILALCTSAVRTAVKEWIAAASDAPIDDIKTRAIALTREAVEKLR